MLMDSLSHKPVRELSALLVSRQLSARELLDACLAQIDRVNPVVNAIVTQDREGAYANADAIDARRAQGFADVAAGGLPIAIRIWSRSKACAPRWVRRFSGLGTGLRHPHDRAFPLARVEHPWQDEHAGVWPWQSDLQRRFRCHQNPWDVTKTCGGSSGGAAVAVSTGMLPFADGSDMGGSLRNPANFCGTVGLRTSPGRVPTYPSLNLWERSACSARSRVPQRMPRGCCRCRRATILAWRSAAVATRRSFASRWIATSGRAHRLEPDAGRIAGREGVRDALEKSLKRFGGHRRRDRGGCAGSVHRR